MSALYDLYQPGESWLHRLDPRARALAALCGCACAMVLRNVWLIALALMLANVLLRCAGVARHRLAWVWRMTGPPMAMIAVLWVLLYRGEGSALVDWWFLRITAGSLAEGIGVALRIGLLAFTVLSWLFTTDQSEIALSIVGLGLPYSWALTMAMALRYLPTLAGAFRAVSEAQQARALDLTRGSVLQRARAYIPITVAMIISAIRTAERLSFALEARALGAYPRRTYIRVLRLRPRDWAVMLMTVVLTLTFLWARFAHGVGAFPLLLWG